MERLFRAGLLLLLFSFSLFLACAPSPGSSLFKEGWEREWQETLAVARTGGVVVVYFSGEASLGKALAAAFRGQYSIKVELIRGSPEELAEKIVASQRSGLPLSDLYLGSLDNIFPALKAAGALEPLEPALILPEVRDPKVWWQGKLPWSDAEHKAFAFAASPGGQVAIRTGTVLLPGELTTLSDLLKPKWKGALMINDPTLPGEGASFVGVVANRLGWDFWRQLVRQEPYIFWNEPLQVEWVTRGEYSILLAPRIDLLLEAGYRGYMHFLRPPESAYVSGDAVLLLKGTAHRNSAKVFINWLLSQEGQRVYTQFSGAQSGRIDFVLDAPPEGPRKSDPRQPGVDYFDANAEEFILQQPEHRRMAREIFAPLLK